MSNRQTRRPGPSIRLKLALSYALFLMAAAWVTFLAVLAVVLAKVPARPVNLPGTGPMVLNRSEVMGLAMPYALSGTVLLALIGLGGGWLLAGRMLRPLTPISEAAIAAAGGSLKHRINLPGPDDELRRLADVFDEMLARLEQAFENQRRFTANASHELRTPHAAMKTILEVARLDLAQGTVEAEALGRLGQRLGQLQELNDRSITMIETLLRLARVEAGRLATEPCDLATLVSEVMREVDHAPGRTVYADLAPAPLVADALLLHHLILNLVTNAERHNLPEGGMIAVRTRTEGDTVVLEVENTGAVLSPEVVATLTQPFVRGGGRLAERSGGQRGSSGLGLSLVDSITRAHRGQVTLTAREGGGLLVKARLPRT